MAFSIIVLFLAITIVVYGIVPLITRSSMNTSTSTPTSGAKSHVRDFFLYILMGGVFYFLMFDVVSLLFSYINELLPDIAQGGYDYFAETIRTQLASLIVLFPVYVGVAWYLRKDLNQHVEKAEFGLRKFFVYMTLFLVAIALIADLITLINYYLDGELTLRFGLKVLAVFVVATGVGSYFLYELKRDPKSPPSKTIAGLALVAFIAVIVTGLYLSGSPTARREEKIDNQHVQNIQNIANSMNQYWAAQQKVAPSINDLSLKGDYPLAHNPVTDAPYEYRVLSAKNFEVCADFMRATPADQNQYRMYPSSYNHPAGHYCYQFEMKDRYPTDGQTYIESVPVML